MSLGWIVFFICVLAGCAFFFSVNASALRIFSLAKLQDAFKSAKKEHQIDGLVENTEKLILTCSLYRLITNCCILLLLLHVFVSLREQGPQISDYLLTFIIASVLFSIFSLATPYAWAKYAGEKILSRTYKFLMLSATVATPVLYVFGLYDSLVKRLAGVGQTTPEEEQEEKQEEFLTDLEQHRIDGVVDKEEQEMIESVLELDETTADEIMTPRTDIAAVEVNSDLQAILDTITSVGHTRVPVYEENIDKIIGMIYAKDLLTEIGKKPGDFKLRTKMREAYFVPETKPLRTLLHEFQNQKLHIAVVLDEYGGTAGIVTLEDIIEELVGEIADEYEETPPKPVKKIDQNTIEADARTYVDDLNDQFELNLPEDEDYDTIGGFVFSHLGYIPKTGESFEYENLKFTIASAEARRIKRVKIARTEKPQS
ncbi:MAG: CBS domain-containing protein [Phycisphaerae bacterium]|nr:HlyC/CorC family transporter [Phycisphaerae bacterium]NIW70759.1 CBS domain-containing protein [candidate division KSB1 bacterium]NIP51508.1 HlyC/CorC family transporter [Phycisphaerae bacterium]NIS50688.1 HlyC/CorC family transporter [Phycisphaerae bacterium]NIU08444.1 HlyC/CorC family transporter [Phycisphaerae bacterium]